MRACVRAGVGVPVCEVRRARGVYEGVPMGMVRHPSGTGPRSGPSTGFTSILGYLYTGCQP